MDKEEAAFRAGHAIGQKLAHDGGRICPKSYEDDHWAQYARQRKAGS